MIWNLNKECMSRDEMSALQGKRLHKIVEYVYHNVPFYRNKLQEMDITPDDIRTIEDIKKLPFTTKKDLRDNYPFGLQAAPQSEIIRIHASSGTTGNPTIVGYTRKDIGIWSECMARCLTSYGVTRNDVFSVSYGYGLFTGGLGAHNGVELLGASVVPASTGNTEKHAKLIRDLGITGIACTPSYALYLAETMEKMGITKDQIKLRVGAFGAEPWTESMREEIQERLGLKGFNLYGLSEIMGRRPLLSRDYQSCDTGASACWRTRRIGIHHLDKGRYASAALSYTRPLFPASRRVQLRTNQRAHECHPRTKRRYAYHSWYQCLPITGGKRSPKHERVCTTLYVGRRSREQPRHVGGTGRAPSGILHCYLRYPCRYRRVGEALGSQVA